MAWERSADGVQYVEDVWVTGIGVEDVGQSLDSPKNPSAPDACRKKNTKKYRSLTNDVASSESEAQRRLS